jgi:hypothetical protein
MSRCEFCQTESSIIFKCPHCGNRFCKEHRKPEKHNCPGIQNTSVDKLLTEKELVLEQSEIEIPAKNEAQNFDLINEAPQMDDRKLDESIEIVRAQSRAVLANLFGTLSDPEDYDEDKKEKYDKIYEYFLKIWKKNDELRTEIDGMKKEISDLKDKLEKKNIEYEKLLEGYKLVKND